MTKTSPRVGLLVNKTAGRLGPSETFLYAHATQLPTETVVVLGNPGNRRFGLEDGPFLQAQHTPAKGARWVARQAGLQSASGQDERALARFLKAQRVEVALAEYGHTAVTVMGACARADVPLVAHFHGWDAYVLPQRPGMMEGYRQLFAQAVGIVAVSRHMVEQLVSLGAPAERVHWNPCGAHVPATQARPGDAGPAFVAVGRFTGKKAPFLTLAAFAQVRARHPDARLDMIGDGPLLPASQQLALGLGIDDAVTFHGATEHDRVYELIAGGRCFVQHSVTAPDGDREGTPVSVLEAMALGIPVVSTRHTGIQDVVAEGTCGTLVDEYDVEGMAEAMKAYAADPELARRVGAAAREAVVSTWSMDRSIERLWSIVQHAVGGPPPSAPPAAS